MCVCEEREREKMASAVVKFALEKVGNILIQEGLLLYGVRDIIEWLRTELRWMECFLIDAERKEKKGDERVKNWVMEVRDVVFQAEDVMDTIIEQIDKRRKLLLGRRSTRIIRLLKREDYEFNIPEEVGGLIHLRYFKLTGFVSCSLPPSIGNLSNLQTLDVRGITQCTFPKSLWKIQTLVRFRCHGIMPSSDIGRLKMLQILENVKAGGWMRQLKELSCLRKLAITQVVSGNEQVDMLCDSLCKLDHLTSLYLEIFVSPTATATATATTTLFNSLPNHRNFRKLTLSCSGLGPYTGLSGLSQNLANLSLEGVQLAQETVTALEGLQGLVVLQIRQCRILGGNRANRGRIYVRGGFPRLRHLRLAHLGWLRYLRIESGAMKDLAQLTIDHCMDLRMMPEGLEQLASLKKLEVSGMPPGFVRRIREGGEDFHKIQHIPSIQIMI
ncbi:putative disease resistance protein isoform X1 [Iris pallida]|uniref:Disease resistance protein isoform X1 n=1 Tax=Iris pallida TaxID=29817 RepID=A0AAX6I4B6_IRIPA|nr:putative disease resistance protein isoform X1 [Iris pallida]